MKLKEISYRDLAEEVESLGEKHRLERDDAFVLWFLRAYVSDDEEITLRALAGGAGDKSVDAVLVDGHARVVFVVQGKYRHALNKGSEKREDVQAFADLAYQLQGASSKEFKEFCSGMDSLTADMLKNARRALGNGGHRLILYYATLSKVSSSVVRDAAQKVRVNTPREFPKAEIEIFDGNRAMHLYRDYIDGVAPPIPELELEMEYGKGVQVRAMMHRYDGDKKIDSWVIPMRGDRIGTLYEMAGDRLFARNIRGFLGEKTSINKDMIKTLKSQPENFFYFNNGVTIVCDQAEQVTKGTTRSLRVTNPQVINGQQTTRTLAQHPKLAADASVLVKVMAVPRDPNGGEDAFDGLVSNIVAGTNWQNAIKQADLRANDRRQVALERELRKLGYIYVRKRQSKSEAKRKVKAKHLKAVTKEELAQAVAGCELDPVVARSGKDNLFAEDRYDQVFPSQDALYYLNRYQLMRQVAYVARGVPQRSYFKWLVLGFVWSELRHCLNKKSTKRAFSALWGHRDDDLLTPLNRAIDRAYRDAWRFYRKNRGKGDEEIDPSQFFRSYKGRHRQFRKFWQRRDNPERKTFKRAIEQVGTILEEA